MSRWVLGVIPLLTVGASQSFFPPGLPIGGMPVPLGGRNAFDDVCAARDSEWAFKDALVDRFAVFGLQN